MSIDLNKEFEKMAENKMIEYLKNGKNLKYFPTSITYFNISNDDIYFKLGRLDSEIYLLRQELTFDNPFTDEYKEKVKRYNKFCEERLILENSLDNNNEL